MMRKTQLTWLAVRPAVGSPCPHQGRLENERQGSLM